MKNTNRIAVTTAVILSGLVSLSAFAACGSAEQCDWNLTPIEDNVGFHTELQQSYLDDDYNNISKYAKGVEELSRPEAIRFAWEATPLTESVSVTEYVLEISVTDDFKNPVTYRTVGNTGAVYNLQIATDYYWRVQAELSNGKTSVSSVSTFRTDDNGPRNLYVDGITNVRDLGGWKIVGESRVPQGLIYRCGRLNGLKAAPSATASIIIPVPWNGMCPTFSLPRSTVRISRRYFLYLQTRTITRSSITAISVPTERVCLHSC